MFLEVIVAVLFSVLSLSTILPLLERSIHALPALKDKVIKNASSCIKVRERNGNNLMACKMQSKNETYLLIAKSEEGFSLLEILVSLTVAMIVLIVLNKTLALAQFHSKALQQSIKENTAITRLQSETTRLLKLSDYHSFPISPKLHPFGQILMQDQQANYVMHGSLKLRPSEKSQALSNVKAVPSLLADITSCSAVGNLRSGQACLRYASTASSSDYQSFALVSVDGIYEGIGSFSGHSKCKDFSVTLGSSVLLDNPGSNSFCTERLIIPLDFVQTLYQSALGDFRIITHRGIQNVENQPITRYIPQIELNLAKNGTEYEIKISNDSQIVAHEFLALQVARQNMSNFIFNRL